MRIRHSESRDDDAIWRILESTFRAGETYPIPRDISRSDALAYWHSPGHTVFVAEDAGTIIGTYYLRANNRGGGAHVAIFGYVVAPDAFGRGVARAMCAHSLDQARMRKFTTMQFNFVIASNERAVRLWQSLGFAYCWNSAGSLPAPAARRRRRLCDGPKALNGLHFPSAAAPILVLKAKARTCDHRSRFDGVTVLFSGS